MSANYSLLILELMENVTWTKYCGIVKLANSSYDQF